MSKPVDWSKLARQMSFEIPEGHDLAQAQALIARLVKIGVRQ